MNINRYTKIFIKNTLLGLGDVCPSLTNYVHVLRAVERAYRDMQPRTFKNLRDDAKIDATVKKSILIDLADQFVGCFKAPVLATQADFDKWHNDICSWFLNEFNKRVMRHSGYADIKYGKAQKTVNIAFKYLYLFCNIVPGEPNHFTFCHFTIDSYTLEWYKRYVDPNCKVKNWSDMTYDEYIEIQKNIRAYLSTQSKYPKEPFLAEFEIWSEYAYGK